MTIFEVSDEDGNSCFVEGYDLAMNIVRDLHNPFINIVQVTCNISLLNEKLIRNESEFEDYFY